MNLPNGFIEEISGKKFMLNIIVCIKQVPKTGNVEIDKATGTLNRKETENIINPDDLHALELALYLKEQYESYITVLTMGPDNAEDILYEAYAMGVDKCVLLSDERFRGADTFATSLTLSRAIKKLGEHDLVLTGITAIDGNTSHVGYQLSEFLNIPLVTQIHDIEIIENYVVIERLYGHEYQKIRVDFPMLLSSDKETNIVRFPKFSDINFCFEKKIILMNLEDLGGSENDYGLKGSPSIVIKTESFTHKRKQERVDGNLDEKVDQFIGILKKQNILKY
ncbi:MAG: electron transfer flavoprotein subunit beta/FixA family protein [Desulfobacula sp.]|nr:electron transfer flavoprotein subunit beta/FixA family protein [Desulfobacula sp.]